MEVISLVTTWPAVTRATRKKLQEDGTLLQDGNTETRDVELKDTCFPDVNDNFLHGDVDMTRYSTDMDHKSCLDIDEGQQFHLSTDEDQKSEYFGGNRPNN